MRSGHAPRHVLFAFTAVALILSAVLFAGSAPRGHQTSPLKVASGARDPAPPLLRVLAGAHRREAALRRAASRFLSAFLPYEVGENTPSVAIRLRRTAAPSFARRLLARPPRPPASGVLPPLAQLRRLHVAFLSGVGERALISGTARRGGALEEFSFLFERRHGRWLAAGAGE